MILGWSIVFGLTVLGLHSLKFGKYDISLLAYPLTNSFGLNGNTPEIPMFIGWYVFIVGGIWMLGCVACSAMASLLGQMSGQD
jgi:hypothetical protein